MQQLMERIIRDRELVDAVLKAAKLTIVTYEGAIVEYVGDGMVKNQQNGIEGLSIDSIESIVVGKMPKVPAPILSTPEQQNGIPLNVASADDNKDSTEGSEKDRETPSENKKAPLKFF